MATLVGWYPTSTPPKWRLANVRNSSSRALSMEEKSFTDTSPRNPARTGLPFGGIDRNVSFGRDRSPGQEDLHLLRVVRLHRSDRKGIRLQPGVHRRRIDRERTAQGDAPLPVIEGGEGEFPALFSAGGDVLRLQSEPVEGDLHGRIRRAILEPHGVPVDDRFLDGDPPWLLRGPFPLGFHPCPLCAGRFLRIPIGPAPGGRRSFHRRRSGARQPILSPWRSRRS